MSAPVRVVTDAERAADRGGAHPGSALARMREAAAAQRRERTLELPVGGAFSEQLVVRYGVLPLEEMDHYADLATGRTPRLSALTVDMMVAACRTVLWREDGTETDLEVGLDGGLWELLGWPLPPDTAPDELTPREVVLALFGGNGMAVVEHAEGLMTWMRGGGVTPGESSGGTS